MIAAVPSHVHEADELLATSCSDPAQTVLLDLIPPTGHVVAAVGLDQLDHLLIGERASPRIPDLRTSAHSGSRGSLEPWKPTFANGSGV